MTPDLLYSRIIQTLELIASRDAQLRYQARAPDLHVSTELLLQWEDWYRASEPALAQAFEADQRRALQAFHAVFVQVRDEVMFEAPPLPAFIQTPAWRRYHEAARTTLGRLQRTRAAA